VASALGNKEQPVTTSDDEIFAFVLMPFDQSFDDVYKLGIKETANQLGILAERVDEQIFREGILERIYRQIEAADLIIADMSGQNPNVFYEVGYAHAKGKLCVLMTRNTSDIPFDLKHHRHIVYEDSILGLRDRLLEELAWAKNEIANVRASKIKVALKSAYGNLEKTKYLAGGTVEIKIDLLNESKSPSAEIDAIYFYSGPGWTLYQDGRDCPSTDSDLPDFKARHFLNPPIRRLHKNSWAQVKFEAKKILAFAKEGDELKDSYRISGRSVIRLVTSEGNFDYELPLDVTVDELPF
jgi:nucleoside 2-deoxyribosyltransferase